jgi:hypothetical protein
MAALAAILLPSSLPAQITFQRTYGGASDDAGNSVQQTTDGGYIIAGTTASYGAGHLDFFLVKINANGDTLWTRTFGGTLDDVGMSVQETADSGYIIAGTTYSFGAGLGDVYLIKTSTDGDVQWTRTFGGAGDDFGCSVRQTADSGYVIAGCTNSFGAGSYDVYFIKTNAHGDTLWTRVYGGADGDGGNSVQQAADGGYIIAGSTYSLGAGGADIYLIKTDSLGNVAVAEPKASPTRAPALSLTCEPNPCHGSAVLHLTTGPLDHSTTLLRVYDAQGRMVHSVLGIRASSFAIDLRALPSGAYFIRGDIAGEHTTARLVVQR